jgi:hypothetical protein
VSGGGANRRPAWQGDHRRQIRGVTFDTAFRDAMEGSARILSGHGEAK